MRHDECDLTPVQLLAARADPARRGEPAALEALQAALEADPGPWPHLGDLAAGARRAWIALAAGPDPAAAEALGRHVDGLAAELAGLSPTPIERLLAENAATCWLQAACCDAAASAPEAGVKLAAFLLERQDRAHRRYLAAMKALTDLRPRSAARPDSGSAERGRRRPSLNLVAAEPGGIDPGDRGGQAGSIPGGDERLGGRDSPARGAPPAG